MTHPILERRRREQSERIRQVEAWAVQLAERLDVVAVVVFGSVARGDFNKWSDVDVLVVARGLPEGARDRLALLGADSPLGVQPIGWTPEELARRVARRDPIARECEAVGVVVYGALDLAPAAR
jgi:predicted nucleotidyltransferase